MAVLKANFNSLSAAEKADATAAYNEKYGKYTSKYASLVTRAKSIKVTIGKDILEQTARV